MVDPRTWWAIAWTAVHCLWVCAAIGGGVLVLRALVRRCSPRARYLLALTVLGTLAAAPFAVFGAMRASGEPPATSPPPSAVPLPAALPAAEPAAQAELWLGERIATEPLDTAWLADVLDALPVVWTVVLVLGLLWMAVGLVSAAKLARAARPLPAGALDGVDVEAARAVGLRRAVRFAASDAVASPVALGTLRPLVVLPTGLLHGWSRRELEMVLLHELSHVRRWDNLVNVAQRAVECLLFFHPVARWVSHWVRLEREQCCDAAVVAHTGEPQRYVRTLLALATPSKAAVQAGMAMSHSPLVDRVRTLLNQESKSMTVPRSVSLSTLGLLAFSVLLLSGQAQVPPPPDPPDPQPLPRAVGVPAPLPELPAPVADPRSLPPDRPLAPAVPLPPRPSRTVAAPAVPHPPQAPHPCPHAAPLATPSTSQCTDCHTPHHPPEHAAPKGHASTCASCHQQAPGSPSRYRVKKGDSLYKIARGHAGLPVERLIEANPGIDPHRLRIGQELRLPAPAPRGLPHTPDYPVAPPRPDAFTQPPGARAPASESVDERIQRLEETVRQLQAELKRLKSSDQVSPGKTRHRRIVSAR